MRRDLVEAARRGDHEAFEVLATSAGDRLFAVARLILRASDLAEDAVQEALVRAWQQLPSLRDLDRFDAWLHRLVVNACADQGRQLRRWSQQVQPLQLDAAISDDTGSVADREQLARGVQPTEARTAGSGRPPLLQRILGSRNSAHARHT
jgi:DNA-directed RNA polymerase specialized sigma24 family protein